MTTTTTFATCLVLAAGAATSANPLHFVDVTASRIVQTVAEEPNNEKAIDFGDFDNDGDLDVVIGVALSDFGAKRNKLYRNDNGVFTEVTTELIPGFLTSRVTRVAFLRDFDGDGWLDIYTINDQNSHVDRLFINQHPGGVVTGFTEVFTIANGGNTGAACGGVAEDFDQDGDIDVYCGNYPNTSQDRVMVNNGAGVFSDLTGSNVPSDFDYTLDISAADMNNDGRLDLLVANMGDPSYIYYNNLNDAGSGMGDYRYTGSTQSFPTNFSENAMEPADFNNDGLMDFYWGNGNGDIDQIRRNTGNDGSNKAQFSTLAVSTLPPSVTTVASRKITVDDLNDDGRIDAIVMKEDSGNTRPTILRNTTVNGQISFVDWTEASAFPNGSTHEGWHCETADTNGDGDLDIFLGAFNDDHLFEQEPAPTFDASTLTGGVVPGVFNGSATVVESTGTEGASGNTFHIENVSGASAFISAIVTGGGAVDLKLEVLQNGNLLAESDRGGAGVEEALQVNNLPAGTISVRVSGPNVADLNSDTVVDGTDLAGLLAVWGSNGGSGGDFNDDNIVDGQDLATMLANWGAANIGDFTLEVLARN